MKKTSFKFDENVFKAIKQLSDALSYIHVKDSEGREEVKSIIKKLYAITERKE